MIGLFQPDLCLPYIIIFSSAQRILFLTVSVRNDPFLFFSVGQKHFDLKAAPRNLHIGQTVPLLIPADLINLSPELIRIMGLFCQPIQSFKKFLNTLHLQGGTEEAGKHLPVGNQGFDIFQINSSAFEVLFKHCVIANCQTFHEFFAVPVFIEIDAALTETFFQFCYQCTAIRPLHIHFIDKQKGGNLIPGKKSPECIGMYLDPFAAADYKNGTVKNLKGPLHLSREIHMPRCIQQRNLHISICENSLLRKYGNTPGTFQRVGIQKRILMVHPAQPSDTAGQIQHAFCQCCFSRIYMGQYTDYQLSHLTLRIHQKSCTIHITICIIL